MFEALRGSRTAAVPRQERRPSDSVAPSPRVTPPSVPVRSRRRPALVVAGVLLVGFGGLGSAWLVTSAGGTTTVLALAHDVAQGEVITAADLVVVRLTPSLELAPVAADQRGAVIGQRAAARLSAGSLLTAASVTASPVPGAGQSVVGVSLTPAQMPSEQLAAGDPVRIVSTPLTQADPPSDAPAVVPAEVVQVSEPDAAGARTVDVVVPELQAADLAARAATGRVALVLDARGA